MKTIDERKMQKTKRKKDKQRQKGARGTEGRHDFVAHLS